jgi:hypothetical protein
LKVMWALATPATTTSLTATNMAAGAAAIMWVPAGDSIIVMIMLRIITADMRLPIDRRRPDVRRLPCRMAREVAVGVIKA